ncbi:hypothetical protein ACQ4PT_028813 [Festuca glaucescens]
MKMTKRTRFSIAGDSSSSEEAACLCAPRYPAACSQTPTGELGRVRNVRAWLPQQEVEDAARLTCEGRPFDVTYYPWQGAREFVVPRKEVEDAMQAANWEPGMHVRMKFLDAGGQLGARDADPHPGSTPDGHVGFLDFGLLCEMEKNHKHAMLSSIVHIVNGDWASLVYDLTEIDVVPPRTNLSRLTMFEKGQQNAWGM